MCESCNSQSAKSKGTDRPTAVAGQFYANDTLKLKADLSKLFASAEPKKYSHVSAIIAPHAGYIFSGAVAASAYNQIDPEKKYDRVFIIGTSHHFYFDGAAVYTDGNYKTPFGIAEVDTALGSGLMQKSRYFIRHNQAHFKEHSLEVQIPFIQYHLKKPFQIVPIVIGTDDAAICKELAKQLEPYFNDNNLFVISTDFSHYPNYSDANTIDKVTAEAIEHNSAAKFLETIKTAEKKNVKNLATSICGWTSVLTLLYLTEQKPGYSIKTIQYKNSGDNPVYGDSSRVVGYYAMAVVNNNKVFEFSLSDEEKKKLLSIAEKTLEFYIKEGKIPETDSSTLSPGLKTPCGAFVSLYKNGNLRGCIGRFDAQKPLYLVVQDMTIASATEDSRFSRVSVSELEYIDIEISVLTPMKKIQNIAEIELGIHGIYIKKGTRAGTFLPQVATQTGWSKEEFLGHCAADKAGIGWNGWKDADIYTYKAIVFGDKK